MDKIVFYLNEYMNYLFMAWIALYFFMRKAYKADRSRYIAVFLQGILFFVLFLGALIIDTEELNTQWMGLVIGVTVLVAVLFRKPIFPYRRTCVGCGGKVDWKRMFIKEDDLCPQCLTKEAESDS